MGLKRLIGAFSDRDIREAFQGFFGVETSSKGTTLHLFFLEITFTSTTITVRIKDSSKTIFSLDKSSIVPETVTKSKECVGYTNLSNATAIGCFKIAQLKVTRSTSYVSQTMLVTDAIQGSSIESVYLVKIAQRGATYSAYITLLHGTTNTSYRLNVGVYMDGMVGTWYLWSSSTASYRKMTVVPLGSHYDAVTLYTPVGETLPTGSYTAATCGFTPQS